ncbi:hypothetical protein ACF0H5_016394 [Mactra antiquata]
MRIYISDGTSLSMIEHPSSMSRSLLYNRCNKCSILLYRYITDRTSLIHDGTSLIYDRTSLIYDRTSLIYV